MKVYEVVQKDVDKALDFFRLYPEAADGKIIFVRSSRSGIAIIFHAGLWKASYAEDGRVFNSRATEAEIRLTGKWRYKRKEFEDILKEHLGDVEFIKSSLEKDFM